MDPTASQQDRFQTLTIMSEDAEAWAKHTADFRDETVAIIKQNVEADVTKFRQLTQAMMLIVPERWWKEMKKKLGDRELTAYSKQASLSPSVNSAKRTPAKSTTSHVPTSHPATSSRSTKTYRVTRSSTQEKKQKFQEKIILTKDRYLGHDVYAYSKIPVIASLRDTFKEDMKKAVPEGSLKATLHVLARKKDGSLYKAWIGPECTLSLADRMAAVATLPPGDQIEVINIFEKDPHDGKDYVIAHKGWCDVCDKKYAEQAKSGISVDRRIACSGPVRGNNKTAFGCVQCRDSGATCEHTTSHRAAKKKYHDLLKNAHKKRRLGKGKESKMQHFVNDWIMVEDDFEESESSIVEESDDEDVEITYESESFKKHAGPPRNERSKEAGSSRLAVPQIKTKEEVFGDSLTKLLEKIEQLRKDFRRICDANPQINMGDMANRIIIIEQQVKDSLQDLFA
ncbi:hypothetical protein CALVIDRAFT_567521 [Calocera viscosa TUFC12733]|uniref:Uncharacterized protein n=1 Tax=Calocera viscosa (strain TUFC12733) TaxID=1330018 RepID=A0A167I4N7_CALVF|nr:hypothetical protein CALVIDRAFT_567521 [Calocera viscosa TUFC12733]